VKPSTRDGILSAIRVRVLSGVGARRKETDDTNGMAPVPAMSPMLR
jgi:hypothetical protein